MLRHAVSRGKLLVLASRSPSASSTSSSLRLICGARTLVTSAQKRALDKKQLAGEKAGPSASAAKDAPLAAPAGSASAEAAVTAEAGAVGTAKVAQGGDGPASGGGGGGGTGATALGLVALGAVGVGGAYYYDIIDFEEHFGGKGPEKKEEKPKAAPEFVSEKEEKLLHETVETKEAAPEPVIVAEAESLEAKETMPEPAKEAESDATKEEPAGHRVTSITVPPADEDRPTQVVPTPEHPANAHRVTGLPAKVNESAAGGSVKEANALVSAEEAAKEIAAATDSQTEEKLRAAHRSLRANLEDAYLNDIDNLSESELRVRVVQLASEMEERTKWEAVRLKEFLSMKEKETADKYLEVLQKQRAEFEDLLARRLREQEDALSRQANAALQAKDESIQSVIAAAAEAQRAELDAELKSATERIDRETEAKCEAEFGSKLANEKAKFAEEMEAKVVAIEQMTEKLRKLEQVLEVSRSFESGSQFAHRVSAAGLAFATKAETSKGAGEELAALNAAASEESVIAAALSKIPSSIKSGVPTLPELQTKFDKVYSLSREAAFVPEGRTGLGGQLLGMAFAKVTIPPPLDSLPAYSPAPSSTYNTPEYILARALRHVQLGELESALGELDSLEGQPAYVVRDWKQAAMDRIAVDKAVKVIKMECALLNKNMGGASTS